MRAVGPVASALIQSADRRLSKWKKIVELVSATEAVQVRLPVAVPGYDAGVSAPTEAVESGGQLLSDLATVNPSCGERTPGERPPAPPPNSG